MIDHSVLHPTYTDEDLKLNCEIAREYHVATVCVKPYHTRQASEIILNSDVGICSVIGFPHGNSTIDMKIKETLQVITDGATEVDMVINIGKALQGDWEYIENEIGGINESCVTNRAILKVIFETDFLTADADKIKLCEICSRQKVAFVKTSTGFGFAKGRDGNFAYTGATEKDIILMRKHCIQEVRIKAAGGVRNLDELIKMHELGASRIGTSATESIMEEAIKRFGK